MGGQNKNNMQQVVNELLGLMHQLVKSDASKEQILKVIAITHEAVTKTVATEVPAASSKADDVTEEPVVLPGNLMKGYILQLEAYAEPLYASNFSQFIDRLIADKKVGMWLLTTSKSTFKEFNKQRIFKLAKMLMQKHILSIEKDVQLNKILELTDADTSYRRNVNAEHNDDKVILSIVTEIIEEYKNQVAGTVL